MMAFYGFISLSRGSYSVSCLINGVLSCVAHGFSD